MIAPYLGLDSEFPRVFDTRTSVILNFGIKSGGLIAGLSISGHMIERSKHIKSLGIL